MLLVDLSQVDNRNKMIFRQTKYSKSECW